MWVEVGLRLATCMLQRSAKSGTTSSNIRAEREPEVKQDERCKTN